MVCRRGRGPKGATSIAAGEQCAAAGTSSGSRQHQAPALRRIRAGGAPRPPPLPVGLGCDPASSPRRTKFVSLVVKPVPGRPGGFVQFLCRAGPRFAEIRRRRSERGVLLVRHLASSPPAMHVCAPCRGRTRFLVLGSDAATLRRQFGEANQAADLMAENLPKPIQAQWEETLRRLCAATPLKGHSCRRLLHCAGPAEHEVDEVRQSCALFAFRLIGLAAAQLGLLPVSGFRCIAGEGLREPNLVKGSLPADTLRHVSTHNSESSSRVVSTPTCLDTPTLSGQ
ncbi:hypothetical protein VDGL01_12510 [Verticillium dahliae]